MKQQIEKEDWLLFLREIMQMKVKRQMLSIIHLDNLQKTTEKQAQIQQANLPPKFLKRSKKKILPSCLLSALKLPKIAKKLIISGFFRPTSNLPAFPPFSPAFSFLFFFIES